jgi:hypothetical protein
LAGKTLPQTSSQLVPVVIRKKEVHTGSTL